ncbi:UDP-N-acetylmuramoyl-tripeptide--D-alanyl-D-alanine ligase [Antarcticibacterium arcticum]|uniref:UDP-N-acetylmuramoyl-tripeptide--D-alanyl-D-alanine ligase n=1 Tax=Antarcticibacterium arcticum TaxID=2585771 RepID=A0A5B8YM70_9FLAO|nr:UDP-N-acetylmuramoyl-tripeptide--D-alanyl-D-alanine ligase [Antarcticibacterium arcticum]QED38815.1 UDP-N-acetylmuramoyl-tripeptide--D-alanyl-D-alanine ligase [Antarcticibacterium arcticum]
MKIEQLHQLFLQSKGITTDTRSVKTNQLFFALKGDNFNGNTFAWQAIKKSAGYAIIDEVKYAQNDRYIVVGNVLETLQQLARFHRKYLNIPILAITGSNGKTTTKELIHAVLRKKFDTAATTGNLNNHIGVPLTLLSMKRTTDFGIVEMGANHAGEIKHLCEIALPNYGYITNFGKAHLEGFGSIEGVIKAKSEMYDHIKAHKGVIFLNADDPVQVAQSSYEHSFTFGTGKNVDVKAEYLYDSQTAQVSIDNHLYKSTLTGSYNSVNIAAAICIGKYFKVNENSISQAIGSYIPTNNRSQIIKVGGLTLLMDAYNANPTSMKAALESFSKNPAKDKIVILGDMFELGSASAEEHQQIVLTLEKMDLAKIYLVGSNFFKTHSHKSNIETYETFTDLSEALKHQKPTQGYILIKGSRGMALERVLDVLREKN